MPGPHTRRRGGRLACCAYHAAAFFPFFRTMSQATQQQIYMVGGAVRDRLLGLPVQDRDWVVVGATPDAMAARGFLPVGKDFPVFLHPGTHEEYALARTERKSGHGYKGFTIHASPDVTLEEDLARRDLTINAIAARPQWLEAPADLTRDDPLLADPFGGQRDLRAKVLRHVTAAFAEDPVRILRLARFAARFHDFAIAPETLALLRQMVAAGEADHLVPERVWQELSRGLMQARPARMFAVLRSCGALRAVLPELDGAHAPAAQALGAVSLAAALGAPWPVRWACLLHGQDEARARTMGERLRVPAEGTALAALLAREGSALRRSPALDADALTQLLQRCDALRRPARFADALLASACTAHATPANLQGAGHAASADSASAVAPQILQAAQADAPRALLLGALTAAQTVDSSAVARAAQAAGARGDAIGQAMHQARVQAVAQWRQGQPGGASDSRADGLTG